MPPKRSRINAFPQPGEAEPTRVDFDDDSIQIPEITIPDYDSDEIHLHDEPLDVWDVDEFEPSPKRLRVDSQEENECNEQIKKLQNHIYHQSDTNFKRFAILTFCYTTQLSLTLLNQNGDGFKTSKYQDLFEQFLKLKIGDPAVLVNDFAVDPEVLQFVSKSWDAVQQERSTKQVSSPNPKNPFIVDFKILNKDDYLYDSIFWVHLKVYFHDFRDYKNFEDVNKEIENFNSLNDFMKFCDINQEFLAIENPWVYEFQSWLIGAYDSDDGNSADRLTVFVEHWNKENDCIPYVKTYHEQIRDKNDVPQDFLDFINRGNFFYFYFSHFFCRFNTYPNP